MFRPDQVEDLFATRVEALDASAYDQAPVSAAWRLTDFIDADTVATSTATMHLAFDVVYAGSNEAEDERILYDADFLTESTFTFIMAYHVRRTHERVDRKLAYRAAWDALGAMAQKHDDATVVDFRVDATAYSREAELLIMELEVAVHHEMSF